MSSDHLRLVADDERPYDWRTDRANAARDVLTICNDRSALTRGADGKVLLRHAPGSFVQALVAAMLRADMTNLALLGIGFPAHAHAIDAYKNHEGGLDRLRALAGWNEGGLDG